MFSRYFSCNLSVRKNDSLQVKSRAIFRIEISKLICNLNDLLYDINMNNLIDASGTLVRGHIHLLQLRPNKVYNNMQ